jgi:hypothetical protein
MNVSAGKSSLNEELNDKPTTESVCAETDNRLKLKLTMD